MRYIYLAVFICAFLFSCTNLQAMMRTVQAQWSHQPISGLAGFRLYHENTLACEVQNPSATSIECPLDIPDGETWFTLTAFYDNGTESEHSAPYNYVFSSSLNAAFTSSSTGGQAPHTVYFDATSSTGTISSYYWHFGDGSTVNGSTATHTFIAAGTYTVTLAVTGSSEATDEHTAQISITEAAGGNSPPTASLSSSTGIGAAPLSVELDASDSSDSDGQIISYGWDLGDGTITSGVSQAIINHTYTVAGTYNPRVTVTDNGGLTDSVSVPVLVQSATGQNTPPTAAISASATKGKAPLKIAFNGSSSSDTDGTITSYFWNFGDGATARGITVDHTYNTAGKYTVSLTVRDNAGKDSNPATLNIEILPKSLTGPINLQPIIHLLLMADGPVEE